MLVRPVFAVAALLAAPAVADDKPDPAADLKAMVGEWTVAYCERGGKPHGQIRDFRRLITDGGAFRDKYKHHDKLIIKGTIAVDPSKSPRQMDIKWGEDAPGADEPVKAIYKLDGDTLTVCYEFGDGDRPTEFKTKPNTKQCLAVYKRVKTEN